ncbi:MAG: nucleotidyltransferase family protein [Oscillospiraceae bacterium]
MNIAGIVAEYNPFHNGHLFQLEQTRVLGATHIIAVMSGNFCQRCEPACLDKFTRARLACENGVDLVIELPIQYAVGSSERFACGGVYLLNAMGCVDTLSFGSECGDVSLLNTAANAVSDPHIFERTKRLCESGKSYPAAREEAVRELFGENISSLLRNPNNILGIDYIKALKHLGSKIQPLTVKRIGAGHDSDFTSGGFASAGFVRAGLSGSEFAAYVPKNTALAVRDAIACGRTGGGLAGLEQVFLYRIRSLGRDELCSLPDCGCGLGDRLYNAASESATLDELFEFTKTKRYTMSRVRRAVLCAVLGISPSHYFNPPYIRILAIGRRGDEILTEMKKSCTIPISHSLKQLMQLGGDCETTALLEASATDLFSLSQRCISPRGSDFTAKMFNIHSLSKENT